MSTTGLGLRFLLEVRRLCSIAVTRCYCRVTDAVSIATCIRTNAVLTIWETPSSYVWIQIICFHHFVLLNILYFTSTGNKEVRMTESHHSAFQWSHILTTPSNQHSVTVYPSVQVTCFPNSWLCSPPRVRLTIYTRFNETLTRRRMTGHPTAPIGTHWHPLAPSELWRTSVDVCGRMWMWTDADGGRKMILAVDAP